MGTVICGVESTDRRGVGPRAREHQTAFVAADDSKAESPGLAIGICRLDDWRVLVPAAHEARWLFPCDAGASGGSGLKGEDHPAKSLPLGHLAP